MEFNEQRNAKEQLKEITKYLKTTLDKAKLIKKFNAYSGQKQNSYPRIFQKLYNEGISSNDIINHINEQYDRYMTLQANIAKQANEEYAVKREKERLKTQKRRDNLKVLEKENEKVFRRKKQIDMEAEKNILLLKNLHKKKLDYIKKQRTVLYNKKVKLGEMMTANRITKEFYKQQKMKFTQIGKNIDRKYFKIHDGEYRAMMKKIKEIELQREKSKKEVREYLRIDEEKQAFKNKYGIFTENYENDTDNFDELEIQETISIDRIKHFSVNRIIMNQPASNIDVFYRFIIETIDMYNGNNIVLHLRDKKNNKIRNVTIEGGYLGNEDEFKDRIDSILSGDVAGSDILDTGGDYELLMNIFDIQTFKLVGHGLTQYDIIFKSTINTNDLYANDCGFKALCYCIGNKNLENGYEIMKTRFNKDNSDINEFNTVDKVKHFIQKNGLNITLYANGVIFEPNTLKLIRQNGFNQKIGNKQVKLIKLTDDIIKLPVELERGVVRTHNEFYGKIIYDLTNSHFEASICDELELNDNVFIGSDSSLYKCEETRYRKFMDTRMNTFNLQADDNSKIYYVGFDFETVIDYKENSLMRPYSVSYGLFDDDDVKHLIECDETNNEIALKNLKRRTMKTSVGYDCINEFVKWIVKNQKDKRFVFIGFNNANFDNYLLIDKILELDFDDCKVGNIMYNGSQLLNATINGRHTLFDLRRFLTGSLKECCNGFKVNLCKKLSLDHHYYQKLHDNNELMEYIETNKQELISYNENDVLSLYVIYGKFRKSLEKINGFEEISKNLHNHSTIGGITYKRFLEHWKVTGIKLPKLNEEQYNAINKYKCAGRVEMFNGVKFINDEVCSFDACSQYSYVMAILDVYYPTGEIINTDVYISDKIGFYWCDIDQSILQKNNLPNIYPRKTDTENQWDYEGVLENYCISSIIIEELLKNGCDVKIHRGFYFTEKVKSCEMFNPILQMMGLKTEQDNLKAIDSNEYNGVLRETSKLLMNCGSGKVIEGLHIDKTEYVEDVDKLQKLLIKFGNVNIIKVIGKGVMLSYKREEIELLEKEQKPIFLGALIYDYAKTYMWNNSYSIIGKDKLLYTDTDATKICKKDSSKWLDYAMKTKVRHWDEVEKYDARYKDHTIYNPNSKVFGSFEDELGDINKTDGEPVFCCVQKKCWLYSKGSDVKYRFKGLNDNNIILTGKEPFLKIDAKGKYILDVDMKEEINDFYNDKKNILKNNATGFFKDVYNKKEVIILCQQFKKNVRNTKFNVGLDDVDKHNNLCNSVSVVYNVKRVS